MCNIVSENIEALEILPSRMDNSLDNEFLIDTELIDTYIKEIGSIGEKEDIIEKTIVFLKRRLCLDGIGIRLQEGNDFPYYTTLGFSDAFVKAENYLCKKDEDGNIVRDEDGKPILECMCGEVINKKFSFQHPCFTKRGSFYTIGNLQEIKEVTKSISCTIRGKCLEEGYRSVAIIPIGYNEIVIGLLQMNHRQQDAFSLGLIQTAEEMTAMLGFALGKIIEKEQKRAIKKELIEQNIRKIIEELQILSKDIVKRYA